MSVCHKESCLSTCCDSIRDEIKNLEQKLINIEVWFGKYREDKRNDSIEFHMEINELRRHFDLNNYKKPHKCPVCYGEQIVLKVAAKVNFDAMLRAGLDTHKLCKACEGKGIIWG